MDDESPSSSDPKVPPELERLIFEIAALSYPTNIPKFMLIAVRVKHWIEPLLYRVGFLSFFGPDPKPNVYGVPTCTVHFFLQRIANKPPSFFQSAVKHLFVDYVPASVSISTVNAILAACPRVTDLFVYNRSPTVEVLAGLKSMRRLAIPVDVFFGQAAIDFTALLFRNITHLYLRGAASNPDMHLVWIGLSSVSHLTHVAFDTTSITHLTPTLMKENTHLRYIVHLSWGVGGDNDDIELFRPLSDDARFVCIEQMVDGRLHWLRGADAAKGDDYWALAEAFIAAKLAGKVDRSCYFISDKDQSWRT